MRPHQGSVEGKENLPRPAGHTSLDAPQDPIGFLGSQGTPLADAARLCRDGVRRSKAQQELNLARAAKNNKKGFYRYVSQKRKVKESIFPLDEQEWRPSISRQGEG